MIKSGTLTDGAVVRSGSVDHGPAVDRLLHDGSEATLYGGKEGKMSEFRVWKVQNL